MKLSDYLANYLYKKGLINIYCITGSGSMHFNDSIGSHKNLNVIYTHHEQSAAMAAEGEARISRKPGVVNVSTGPGGTNTLTGVAGAWIDSIPMLIISGQVMKKDIGTDKGYRQLGVQEANVIEMAKPVTKFCKTLKNPYDIEIILDKAIRISIEGKPGPVWIEIPLDVQSFNLDLKKIKKTKKKVNLKIKIKLKQRNKILNLIKNSKKPLIITGYGIRSAKAEVEFNNFLKITKIPVITSWNTIDLIPSNSKLNIGRCGVFGDRASNYAVQSSDLLIVLGSRMSTAQVGYMDEMFSPKSKRIYVEISKKELMKKTFKSDVKINMNVKDFLKDLNQIFGSRKFVGNFEKWTFRVNLLKQKYQTINEHKKKVSGYTNSFRFIDNLSKKLKSGDVVVTDMGTSFTCTMQAFRSKANQRLFTSSGLASMGYGLPATIGACIGVNKKRAVCVTGDGGLMFNIQEFQTIRHYNLPVKIFVIDNEGYLTQKLMQIKNFRRYVGAHPKSGVSCPDLQEVAKSFKIKTSVIDSDKNQLEKISKVLAGNEPHVCIVKIPPMQSLTPRVVMSMNLDGSFKKTGLDNVAPFLNEKEHKDNLKSLAF
jgi:acetolactate synthase-1/2/3 large subunit